MGRPTTLRTTNASGGATFSDIYRVDLYPSPINIGFGVIVTGTVNYTVQHTFDDVWARDFNPATAVWFDHDDIAGETANQDGNYAFPCTGIRITQASGSGSCRMVLIQTGPGSR